MNNSHVLQQSLRELAQQAVFILGLLALLYVAFLRPLPEIAARPELKSETGLPATPS